jgi:hypothetical protein
MTKSVKLRMKRRTAVPMNGGAAGLRSGPVAGQGEVRVWMREARKEAAVELGVERVPDEGREARGQ